MKNTTKPDFLAKLDRLRAEAAWQNLKSAPLLYHVSATRNREAILREGIRGCSTGWLTDQGSVVFFLTDDMWVHNVARDIGANPFDVWAFSPQHLPRKRIKHDNCGEFYAVDSFFVQLDRIPPDAILRVR